MNKFSVFSVIILCMVLFGCSTAKVSSIGSTLKVSHGVNAIAVAPGRGIMSEAVAIGLVNQGYRIIDPAQTSNLMIRLNLTEVDVSLPKGLAQLKASGIDAYLTVLSVDDLNGKLRSATTRVTSTHTGQLIAGITWQNGKCGADGSPCDNIMQSGVTEAAEMIIKELIKVLPR